MGRIPQRAGALEAEGEGRGIGHLSLFRTAQGPQGIAEGKVWEGAGLGQSQGLARRPLGAGGVTKAQQGAGEADEDPAIARV